MNICMIGTGYVGLVSGTCLSDFGHNVICVDKDADKIAALTGGEVPIYELGLRELIERNRKLGRVHLSCDLGEAVDRSLVIFLAVGTPGGEDGRADLSQIKAAAAEVAGEMKEYKVIAIKSTVPVGTAREIRELMEENLSADVSFEVVSNPEFLREGSAVEDFMRPNRVILGATSERALALMRDIYRPLYLLDTPMVCTSNETAEIIKYASNTMLALRISFINEIANLCELLGGDVYEVARAVGMDKRIGPKFLHAGPGYGGSCFPKDVRALAAIARDAGYEFQIAEAVIRVNARQLDRVVEKCLSAVRDIDGAGVAVLGLAFKPNTDDVRESPGVRVAGRLSQAGLTVRVYDPIAMDEAGKELDGVHYGADSYAACAGADLVVVMTEWNEFRQLDLRRVMEQVRTPQLYDTRNIYDPEKARQAGFTYFCTGRP